MCNRYCIFFLKSLRRWEHNLYLEKLISANVGVYMIYLSVNDSIYFLSALTYLFETWYDHMLKLHSTCILKSYLFHFTAIAFLVKKCMVARSFSKQICQKVFPLYARKKEKRLLKSCNIIWSQSWCSRVYIHSSNVNMQIWEIYPQNSYTSN